MAMAANTTSDTQILQRAIAHLRGAELIGPVTNRDLLLELLSWVADFDAPGGPGIDTGLVDRSAEANGGSPIGEPPPHRPGGGDQVVRAEVVRRRDGRAIGAGHP